MDFKSHFSTIPPIMLLNSLVEGEDKIQKEVDEALHVIDEHGKEKEDELLSV